MLVHWTEENSVTVMPAKELSVESSAIEVGLACTVNKYANYPAVVAGIGECLF